MKLRKTRKHQNLLISGIIVIVILLISFSCSSAKNPVNAGPDGIAIKGFDPVGYFALGRPVKGKEQFAFVWKDAIWLFSSRENLELFSTDPEKYAPQYGGY